MLGVRKEIGWVIVTLPLLGILRYGYHIIIYAIFHSTATLPVEKGRFHVLTPDLRIFVNMCSTPLELQHQRDASESTLQQNPGRPYYCKSTRDFSISNRVQSREDSLIQTKL